MSNIWDAKCRCMRFVCQADAVSIGAIDATIDDMVHNRPPENGQNTYMDIRQRTRDKYEIALHSRTQVYMQLRGKHIDAGHGLQISFRHMHSQNSLFVWHDALAWLALC